MTDRAIYTDAIASNNQPSAEPSGDAIEAHRRKFPKVIINVGGVRHEVMWKLFLKRPLTRLGMLAKVGQDIKDLLDDAFISRPGITRR